MLKRQLPPESQGPFQRAHELVLYGMLVTIERPSVAVFQHPGNDCGNLASARVEIAAIGIGFVTVEESEPPAANSRLKRLAHCGQFEAPQLDLAADEVGQGVVMVAGDPQGTDRPNMRETRKQVSIDAHRLAQIGLPPVEQVAQDVELAALGLHVVQELVEASLTALHREVVAAAPIA